MTHPAPEFEHLTAEQARAIRDTVEDIYRRSYVAAIQSGDPFDSPEEFMTRFDAYTSRGNGFELVLARIDGKAVGQAWGWPLQPNARWWNPLRLDDPSIDRDEFVAETGTRTFALSEIMVDSAYIGHGIARALHDELLTHRREQRATLLVEAENQRAYERYLSWGWRKVGTARPSWPDAPLFDVLIRDLGSAGLR
ncbi:GNAT family N-acetyltransferase [Nocardia sp. CDC159]|uniref:GNAT family N-acetyltransferase n=1 Tax=Nocardia pulmonis TaxID=2951408 RepID=A0A9X2EED2_9NOCA|nr:MULTISPECIES: GNAT family N-acetyltransferase [Nocardia]MCM6777915.1 GNAT family N-acetyltransferase [Nocardia pulmonis]MCM6790914.1 GNAT family N-acetyltransferase [Nocardia sp. CDC159]